MKKNNKSPQPQRNPRSQAQSQSQNREASLKIAPSKSPLTRLAWVWTTLVATGWLGGAWSLGERFWDVTISETQPTIQAPGLAGDPFALPFSIRNNSAFFPMVDAEWLCGIDHITNEQGGGLSNLSLEYTGKTTIPPHGVMLGKCPVKFTGKIQATIIPIIKYKTLGIQRTYESMAFTWLPDAQPPQWIAGKPIQ